MWTVIRDRSSRGNTRRPPPRYRSSVPWGRVCRVVGLGSALVLTSGCSRVAMTSAVPKRSELVTIVPFYREGAFNKIQNQWAVFIMAEVDGHRGVFMLDTGTPTFNLNRTVLQPSPMGGIDTVTDANRLPDHVGSTVDTWGQVHIQDVRIGTLDVINVVEPTTPASDPHHVNAFLNHIWNNYEWDGTPPRLGNIGLSVLEPFETIVDYKRQRVVLIRLDPHGASAGRGPGVYAEMDHSPDR